MKSSFRVVLKELRENDGLSQAAFAKKFTIAQSTVGMWEAGKREPDFETTQRLADYFDVSVDYLLGRTDILKQEPLTIPDILQEPDTRFAFHGGTDGLTQRDLDELARMAELLRKKNLENNN